MHSYALVRAVLTIGQLGTSRTDLFSHLLDESTDNASPSLGTVEDLVYDSELAIVAGSDTTASTLASLAYLLSMHPEKQRLLQEELDQLFTGVADISHQKLATEAPMLEACITEVLRLYPGAPSGVQRMTPPGGATIAGRYIPEDNLVSTPTYTLHRGTSLFLCRLHTPVYLCIYSRMYLLTELRPP